MYELAALLIMILAGVSLRWLTPSDHGLRLMLWGLWGAGAGATIAVRITWGGFGGSVAAALAAIIVFSLALAHFLMVRRQWPAHAMGLALCVLTGVAAFQRAMRFEQVQYEPWYPDVAYYEQQAMRTWSPFAPGNKSPLWAALNAPLVRAFPDEPGMIRVLSCCAGIVAVPLMAAVFARYLGGAVGVIVAGLCALDTWMIDLCCQGLREDFNLVLWLCLAAVAFRRDGPSPRGWLGAGLLGGLLLLLRNTNLPALIVVLGYAALTRRWRAWQGVVAIVLPLLIVSPFYVNQWRRYGDAFYLERRDARYYVNAEFGSGRFKPARPVTMAPAAERNRDPYAGDPVSPFDYLFRLHSPKAAVYSQWRGITRAMLGYRFGWGPPVEWFSLLCVVGTIGLLVLPARWITLFVIASVAGMQAHLITIGLLEQRMILQAYPFWLAGGASLLCAAVARGVAAWKPERVAGNQPQMNADEHG